MKILITGAHFTPAQAVIEELKKDPTLKIIYVGRKTTLEGDKAESVESKVLPNLGVKFIPITAGRLNRYFSFWSITAFLKIPVGFIQAFWILLKEQPDIILSFGGYVAFPVVFWGWWFSVPIIVHEQTLISGMSNYLSSFLASKIAVSFDKKYSFNISKIILTGNPIRRELIENGIKNSNGRKSGAKPALPVIYITGGNQGSHVINLAVEEVLDKLTDSFTVIHQTGDSKFKDFERLSENKNQLKNKDRYTVKKWFDLSELSNIYSKADLVVCRAGINTLYELAYFGIPCITVPLPKIHKDEQRMNALFFKEAGLCQIIEQKDLSGVKLLAEIKAGFMKREYLKKRAGLANKVIIYNSSEKLAQETLVLANLYV